MKIEKKRAISPRISTDLSNGRFPSARVKRVGNIYSSFIAHYFRLQSGRSLPAPHGSNRSGMDEWFFLVLWIWVGAFTNRRVTLYDDAIEMTGRFSRRRLERKDILGYRMGRLARQAGGSSFYVIVPSSKNLGELALPPFLRADKAFFTWIEDLPKFTK